VDTIYQDNIKSYFQNLSEIEKQAYVKSHWIHKDGKTSDKHLIGRLLNKWIITRLLFRKISGINIQKTIQEIESKRPGPDVKQQADFDATCNFLIDTIQRMPLKRKTKYLDSLQKLKFSQIPQSPKEKNDKTATKIGEVINPGSEPAKVKNPVQQLMEKLNGSNSDAIFEEFKQLCSSEPSKETEKLIELAFQNIPPENAANFYLKFRIDSPKSVIFSGLLKNKSAFEKILASRADEVVFYLIKDLLHLFETNPTKESAEVATFVNHTSDILMVDHNFFLLLGKLINRIPLHEGTILLNTIPINHFNYHLLVASIAMASFPLFEIKEASSNKFMDRGISQVKQAFQTEILKKAISRTEKKDFFMRDYIHTLAEMLKERFTPFSKPENIELLDSNESLNPSCGVFAPGKDSEGLVVSKEYINGFNVITEALYNCCVDLVPDETMRSNIMSAIQWDCKEHQHNIFLMLLFFRNSPEDFHFGMPVYHEFSLLFLNMSEDKKKKALRKKIHALREYPEHMNIFKETFMAYIPVADRKKWDSFFKTK